MTANASISKGENTRFSGVKLAVLSNASPLKRLAAYTWSELDLYKSLLTTEDDPEYLAFCRGAIAAGERILEKLEELDSPSGLSRDSK